MNPKIRAISSVPIIMLTAKTDKDNNPLAKLLIVNNGDLEINIEKMLIKKQGQSITLTANEFKILIALLTNPGQIFSRKQTSCCQCA